MSLIQLISAIEGNKTIVSVIDDETEIIKFYTGGESQLADELQERLVSTIKIENQNMITVTLTPVD